MLARLPALTRILFRSFFSLVAAFTLLRGLFFLMHGHSAHELSFGLVSRAFLAGFQFDIGAAGLLLLPWSLFGLVPVSGARGVRLRVVLVGLIAITGAAALLLTVGDLMYYGHAAKRISYEPLVLGTSSSRLAIMAFEERPILLPLLIIASLAATLIWWRKQRSITRENEELTTGRRVAFAAIGLLAAGVLFVCARGGTFGRLKTGDAYFSNERVANHAALNSFYSFFRALRDDRTIYEFMPEREAIATVRSLVGLPGEEYRAGPYPLVRRPKDDGDSKLSDVVLILTESLSAETMGCFGNPLGASTFLDGLAAESALFTRFFSSGSRSSHGVFASLFSIPAQLGGPVMHSTLIMNRFRSLPAILREHGYETTFVYGGVYEFTNAEGVLRHAGFERIIGEPGPNHPAEPHEWGYHDEPMLARLRDELARPRERPRLTVFFTQSLHGRKIPEHYLTAELKAKYPKKMTGDKYYRLLHYTDDCLRKFFEGARQLPTHDDTIYVLASDHSNHKNPNLFEDYHIPCMIHAPGRVEPARYDTVGGQLDILPTVLGLLGIETEIAAFGRDLLAAAKRGDEGQAFLTFGDSIGWAEGTSLQQVFTDGAPSKLYDFVADPDLEVDLAKSHPDDVSRIDRSAKAFLQLSRQLLVDDRVYGDDVPAALANTDGRDD